MPAPDAAGRASAAAEITNLADRGGTAMITAFRALFLGSPDAARAQADHWSGPGLRGLGLLQLPATLIARRDYETLFAFARSERFLQEQADEFTRSRPGRERADPVGTLDQALRYASELNQVPEMAAFALSRARWGDRMAAWTPLTALRAGHQQLACALADARPTGQQAFWYLLMAWERYDLGARDSARQLLGMLLPKKLPRLSAREGRPIVVLLRHAAEISPEAFGELQERLLDDNDRTDLCRELTAAGQFAAVPAVAATIRLFTGKRIQVLAEAAKAAIEAGQSELAAAAIAQAVETLPLVEAEAGAQDDGAAGLAELLALVAGAQAAHDDLGAATRTFARALEACGRARPSYGVAPTLRTIAAEQASAGLFGEAARTIARITDHHYVGEALEALALALVRAGQADAAVRAIGDIEPGLYLDYPRAVRKTACALAGAGQPGLGGDLARRWLRPEQHAGALAAIAVAIAGAGDVALAMTLVESIIEPGWRARALTGICRLPGGGRQVAEAARRTVDGLSEAGLHAELLAELAAAPDGEGRGPLFEEALRLAGTLTGQEERWQTLLAIGVAQLTGDPAGADATFAATRRIIRAAGSDPWYLTDELWQVAMTQVHAGDTAGARQTLAEIPGGALPDLGSWLRPVTLAAIAASQAETGRAEIALRACDLALRHAAETQGEWQPAAYRAVAVAQAAAGDLDAAAETVDAMLEMPDAAEEDGEEDVVTEAVEEGIQAAVHVARELARAGRRKRARRLLSEVATTMRDWLKNSAFTYADVTAELACALAELGKNGKASKVAGWDTTGTAEGRLHATVAGRLAGRGDLDGALAAAGLIQHPRPRAQASVAVAEVLTGKGEHATARTLLADTAGQLRAAQPVNLAVPALIEIAAAQADAGFPGDVADTLALAYLAAQDLASADDKDHALSQIAQGWARLGDPERAWELASGIGNDDRGGEALVAAALAMMARDRDDWPTATAIIGRVASPGWRAVGLAVKAAAEAGRRDPEARQYLDFAGVDELVSQVPEGEPRARAQRDIIEITLASGHYEAALEAARGVTAGQSQVLARLVGELAGRGAADAVKSLLPDCARQLESAYAACLALTRVMPGQANAIVTEVAASTSS